MDLARANHRLAFAPAPAGEKVPKADEGVAATCAEAPYREAAVAGAALAIFFESIALRMWFAIRLM